MDGYHDSETFMSDLNALIYGHQMKMAGLFAHQDVVAKLLHEQITLCDSLAKSVKDSQSSESSVQDLAEATAKRKYFEEELKKLNIEGENVWKELNHLLFAKLLLYIFGTHPTRCHPTRRIDEPTRRTWN